MDADRIEGVHVGGRDPKALLLSDGTRLALEEDSSGGRSRWTRVGDDEAEAGLTVADALDLAGNEHADYVRVRTRAEVEWLRLVSEWFEEQARRLEGDLSRAAA